MFESFFVCFEFGISRPVIELPECPLSLEVKESKEWDDWARNQLILDGAHLLGKFCYLQVLIV